MKPFLIDPDAAPPRDAATIRAIFKTALASFSRLLPVAGASVWRCTQLNGVPMRIEMAPSCGPVALIQAVSKSRSIIEFHLNTGMFGEAGASIIDTGACVYWHWKPGQANSEPVCAVLTTLRDGQPTCGDDTPLEALARRCEHGFRTAMARIWDETEALGGESKEQRFIGKVSPSALDYLTFLPKPAASQMQRHVKPRRVHRLHLSTASSVAA